MLTRLMYRTCRVASLKGRTSVGDQVHDSALTPLPIQASGPFLSVYTGQGDWLSGTGNAARPMLGRARCLVVFQYGLTAAMTDVDPQTNERRIIGFDYPPIDAGLQLTLDILGRQLVDALVTPINAWGEFAQRLAPTYQDVRLEPGVSDEDGQRLATHQLSMMADLLREPVERDELITDYLALLATSDDPLHAKQHTLVDNMFGADPDQAEAARLSLGQSLAVWRSGPMSAVDDAVGATPEDEVFGEAEIAVDGLDPVIVSDAS